MNRKLPDYDPDLWKKMWGKKKAPRKVKHTKELDLTERFKVQTSLNKQIEERKKRLLKEQYTTTTTHFRQKTVSQYVNAHPYVVYKVEGSPKKLKLMA